MNNESASKPIPDLTEEQLTLTQSQKDYYKAYLSARKDARNGNTKKTTKGILLHTLNAFMASLNKEQRKILKTWSLQEMCIIDQLIVPSLYLAEFLQKYNLEERLMITGDARDYLICMDSKDQAYDIINKLNSTYPYLETEIVNLHNEE